MLYILVCYMATDLKRIQSVERAFFLLEVLASSQTGLSLAVLAESLGVAKSTAHGILETMQTLGYVARDGKLYCLGGRIAQLGENIPVAQQKISKSFNELLRFAAQQSGETSYLAMPGGSREYVYIDAIESGQNLRLASPRGRREGLTTSAIGLIFLAFDVSIYRSVAKAGAIDKRTQQQIEKINQQGYAFELEYAQVGLNCLAIPLYQAGKCIAALGIAGPAERLNEARLHHLAKVLQHS